MSTEMRTAEGGFTADEAFWYYNMILQTAVVLCPKSLSEKSVRKG
jgi:hypothetical protein